MLGVLDQVPEQQLQEELLLAEQMLDQSQRPNRQCRFPIAGSSIQVGNAGLACQLQFSIRAPNGMRWHAAWPLSDSLVQGVEWGVDA